MASNSFMRVDYVAEELGVSASYAYNPAAKVGNMGKERGREMFFWTQEEYAKFADEMMDKPRSFLRF